MSLVCRPATPDDVYGAALLAAHSFPGVGYSQAAWESLLTEPEHGGLDSLWVGSDDDGLAGACRLLSFDQWVGGAAIPIMGLSTVAVSPTSRRRGVAAELITTAFQVARERGDVASLLYPFRTAFYRKLGYGMAGEAHQYAVPPGWFDDDPGRLRVTVASSTADRRELASIYDRWAQASNGQLTRPEHAWERVWQNESRHGVLYRAETDDPEGYLVFRYANDNAGRSAVEVEESVWLSPEARRALYAWLGSLGDQWEAVVYRAHPQEQFTEFLGELRQRGVPQASRWHFWFDAATILMGPMFRLLEVEQAWNARPLGEGRSTTVALRLHDAHVPQNSGTWTLRMGNLRTVATPGSTGTPDMTIETDIESLSRLFIGSLSPSAAVAIGKVRVDRPNLIPNLDRLLKLPLPWTFDRF